MSRPVLDHPKEFLTNSLVCKSEGDQEFIFKKPLKPAPRKKKVLLLDEETYVKMLDNIIEKDFFPDLENLRDKFHYLEASEANDMVKLRELYAKYSEDSTTPFLNPEDSPATFDTPVANPVKDQSKTPPRVPDYSEKPHIRETKVNKEKQLGLDQFMATYTSEDNESFEKVMEEQEKKWKLKHAWIFEAEDKHNANFTPNLELPSIEEQKQSKFLALTGTTDKEKDIRPLSVDNWNYKAFNSVMFVPDGAAPSSNQSIEKAKVKKREVSQENTRFSENPFNEVMSQTAMMEASAIQAYKKEGKVGIDGKEIRESPKVNGYNYIRSPSPAPGVDCSPLMTWGQIDGTPFQLEGSQTPLIKAKNSQGPAYKIPKVSDRDELLLKLSEKVNQNHRDRKSKALSAARSNFASPAVSGVQSSRLDRLSSMSPAAQKLFSSKLGVHKETDRALRASYTPSPLSKPFTPKSSLTPSSRLSTNTPKPAKRPFTPGIDTSGLTDNLLNLPTKRHPVTSSPDVLLRRRRRKCAEDYF